MSALRDDETRAEIERLADENELLRRALRRTNPLVADWSTRQLRDRYAGDAKVLHALTGDRE